MARAGHDGMDPALNSWGLWKKAQVQEIDQTGAVLGPVPSTSTGGLIKFATTAGHTYRISEAP